MNSKGASQVNVDSGIIAARVSIIKPWIPKVFKIIGICCFSLCLSACSSLRFPWAYQLVVQQGNYVEQNMIDSLEVGMTRRQVKFVMGSPLIEDTFNADRWDYFYEVKRGEDQLTRKLFTVYFEADKLARWDGELTQIAENADGSDETPAEKARDIAPDSEEYIHEGTGDSRPDENPSE